MNNNSIDVEEVLSAVSLCDHSDDFVGSGLKLIRQNSETEISWFPRIGYVLSTALALSLGLNLLLVSRTETDNAKLSLAHENPEQEQISELAESDLADRSSVFRFLCLTKTSVVINNSLNLGELKGFGEWAIFEVPNNYRVSISLLPLREWNAIGQFQDGMISLQPEQGVSLELQGIGLGPSGIQRGGPFPVYGNIEVFAGTDTAQNASRDRSAQLEASANLISNSNFASVNNIQTGIDTPLSAITQKYFGAMLRNGECG